MKKLFLILGTFCFVLFTFRAENTENNDVKFKRTVQLYDAVREAEAQILLSYLNPQNAKQTLFHIESAIEWLEIAKEKTDSLE